MANGQKTKDEDVVTVCVTLVCNNYVVIKKDDIGRHCKERKYPCSLLVTGGS